MLHASSETDLSIQMKKHMISQHQLVSPSPTSDGRAQSSNRSKTIWSTEEEDADGRSFTNYVRKKTFFGGDRYLKQQRWKPDYKQRSGVIFIKQPRHKAVNLRSQEARGSRHA